MGIQWWRPRASRSRIFWRRKALGWTSHHFSTRRSLLKQRCVTADIASLRIHVERRIQRIKTFHIFDKVIPLSLGPIVNQIWVVCTLLSNFQTPIVKELEWNKDTTVRMLLYCHGMGLHEARLIYWYCQPGCQALGRTGVQIDSNKGAIVYCIHKEQEAQKRNPKQITILY